MWLILLAPWQTVGVPDPRADGMTSDPGRPPRPRLPLATLGGVFVGGVVGGLVRYGITEQWPVSDVAFPWSTFLINTTGAFALPLLVVALRRRRPGSTMLRPLLGTGFLGAYTTFSSVMTAVDRQLAHHHVGTAVVYLLGSLVAAAVAVVAGLSLARRLPQRNAA
jgi:CrcB protein